MEDGEITDDETDSSWQTRGSPATVVLISDPSRSRCIWVDSRVGRMEWWAGFMCEDVAQRLYHGA